MYFSKHRFALTGKFPFMVMDIRCASDRNTFRGLGICIMIGILRRSSSSPASTHVRLCDFIDYKITLDS